MPDGGTVLLFPVEESEAISVPTFDEWYTQYPRKVGKRDAAKSWARLTAGERRNAKAALPRHIRQWESEGRTWEKIPHPSTWLNQGRWDDELPDPDVVQERPVAAARWWETEEETTKVAAKLGMYARGGEGWAEFRKRIADAIRAKKAAA